MQSNYTPIATLETGNAGQEELLTKAKPDNS